MMKNMGQMMKQAQQMQARMQEVQQKLDDMLVEGNAGAGMVKVTMTCKGEVKKLKIDPSLVDNNEIEMLEDLITAALNDGRKKAQEKTEEEMGKVTASLGLPGGMKLPF